MLPAHRIWVCAALSLAVHALVIAELPGLFSPPEPVPPPLEARLLAAAPQPAPAAVKPAPVHAEPEAAPRPRPIAPPPPPATEPWPVSPAELPYLAATEPLQPDPPEAPLAEGEPPIADAAPSVAESNAPAEQPEPPPQDPSDVAEVALPAPPVRNLPPTGSIRYELYIGADKLHIGRTVQTWTIDQSTYRLSSYSETTGLIGFFRPYQLAYVSEGRVDASGLRPETFSVRRGRTGARQLAAQFDWTNRELTLGPLHAQRKAALPPGTLDVISFIFQLARADLKPGRLKLNVTNGNKIDTYAVDIGNEEMLELPIGTLRTIPVRQVWIPGQESMEIWLALEQNYLPVRIRLLDREGRMSGEQIANEIMLDAH